MCDKLSLELGVGIYLSWENVGAIGVDVVVVREECIQSNFSLGKDGIAGIIFGYNVDSGAVLSEVAQTKSLFHIVLN